MHSAAKAQVQIEVVRRDSTDMPIFVPKEIPSNFPQALTDPDLTKIFKQHDINGDGQLDKVELKEAFRNLGALIPGWRANRALHHADSDGDGLISEKEMNHLVDYAGKLGYTLK